MEFVGGKWIWKGEALFLQIVQKQTDWKTILCIFFMKQDQKKPKCHLEYWISKERLQSWNTPVCWRFVEMLWEPGEIKHRWSGSAAFSPMGLKRTFFFLISYQLPPPNQSPEHENSSIQCQCICYSCLNVRRKWKLEWGTGSRSRWVWGADVPCQGEGVNEMIKPGWPGQPTLGTVAAGTGNNSSFSALLMRQHSWVHLSTRPQQLFKGKEKEKESFTGKERKVTKYKVIRLILKGLLGQWWYSGQTSFQEGDIITVS